MKNTDYNYIQKLIESSQYTKAYEMLQPLAEKNDDSALLLLSSFSLPNESTEDFEARSLKFIEQSAELGNKDALYTIGVYYESGLYYKIDMKKSSEYFKKSALLGHSRAKLSYGLDLFYGSNGINMDKKLGLIFVEQASNEGVESAKEIYQNLKSLSRKPRLGVLINEES